MTSNDVISETGQSKADRTPFLKFYTDDWVAGTRRLNFETKGFYFELLVCMWERKGGLPNDVEWIAGALKCDPRVVRRILPTLLEDGRKIILRDGLLINKRMLRTIAEQKNRSTSAKDRAKFPRRSAEDRPEIGRNGADRTTKSTNVAAADFPPESRVQSPEDRQNSFSPVAEPKKDDHERVRFSNGKIELFNGMRAYWLERFEGDSERLELGLIQAAGFVQPNSVKPLEAQVSAQLARQCSDKRDRDKRYADTARRNADSRQRAGPSMSPRAAEALRLRDELFGQRSV